MAILLLRNSLALFDPPSPGPYNYGELGRFI